MESHNNAKIRLILIPMAILLTLVNTFWISSTWSGAVSHISLLLNAVFIVFAVNIVNIFLGRINKGLALRPAEMLIVYMMETISNQGVRRVTVS